MLGVFNPYTEEYKHNGCFKKRNKFQNACDPYM